MDDGDTPMASDSRIQELEQRIQGIEQTMTAQHAAQQSHNQEVAKQIGSVHQRVDQQATTLQSHIDQKMAEQLGHIERLLAVGEANKKHRAE